MQAQVDYYVKKKLIEELECTSPTMLYGCQVVAETTHTY